MSVSRGREGVRIYTDDKEALRGQILRSGQRGSATELLEPASRGGHQAARAVGAAEAGAGTPAPQTCGPATAQVSVGLLRERLAEGAQRAKHSWQERTGHAGEAEQAGPRYER